MPGRGAENSVRVARGQGRMKTTLEWVNEQIDEVTVEHARAQAELSRYKEKIAQDMQAAETQIAEMDEKIADLEARLVKLQRERSAVATVAAAP